MSHMKSLPEIDALLTLAHAPTELMEESLNTIERFVILLYNRTTTCTDINKARKELFAKRSSVLRISPTQDNLE